MRLEITMGKGFRATFGDAPNALHVSVQLGPGNYCDNQDHHGMYHKVCRACGQYPSTDASPTAEVAAWRDRDIPWLRLTPSDNVAGWVDVGRIFETLGWLAANPAAISWHDDVLVPELRQRLGIS
jgi:hypothetical protein